MSASAKDGTGRGLGGWLAVGVAAAALGLLMWARLIITAQLPREAIADPPAARDGGAAPQGGRP